MVNGSLLRSAIAVAILLPALAFAQAAGPTIVTINGNPLKINVAADGSFQVYNNAVPGNGQIYPTTCNYGDMGIFADINGTLFTPNFSGHPCGTATGGLGTHSIWTTISISTLQGAGDGPSPFTVVVNLRGGGVTVAQTVTYVNGDNFFRLRTQFTSAGNRTVKAFLGADIFLASSDSGIFFFEPTLHAPGGVDCLIPPTYHILLIPIQPDQATHITDGVYSNVWTQIGNRVLNDNIAPAGCVDNGAALEWDNVLATGVTSALLQSAVSFGSIPTITGVAPFQVSVEPPFVALFPGDSATFDVTTTHNPDTDFNSPIDISLIAPEGITGSFTKTHFPAPGDGTSKLTLTVSPDIFPATYRGITILGNGGDVSEGATVTVDVICDPPILLAINNPQSQTVKRGQTVTLTAKPEAGSVKYQWYSGHAGFTSTPIANATSQSFTTPAINSVQEFWVRITNACGSIDSQTATITPVD
jgi:Ig-like domain-containing protein